MDITHSYTDFVICSNGVIDSSGLIANENGVFDPEEITKILGIKPYQSWKKGDFRKNGTQFLFSSWAAEKSNIERLDVEAQILDTIKNLKSKTHLLRKIKNEYDVGLYISVVPHIYGEEQPFITINDEIIEFCYLSGTTIIFDMYIYQDEKSE